MLETFPKFLFSSMLHKRSIDPSHIPCPQALPHSQQSHTALQAAGWPGAGVSFTMKLIGLAPRSSTWSTIPMCGELGLDHVSFSHLSPCLPPGTASLSSPQCVSRPRPGARGTGRARSPCPASWAHREQGGFLSSAAGSASPSEDHGGQGRLQEGPCPGASRACGKPSWQRH